MSEQPNETQEIADDIDAAIAAIEEKRAARKAELEKERRKQLRIDLDALLDAELTHGDGMILRIDLQRFVPGLPTMALYRLPKPIEAKRYEQMVAKGRGDKADRALKAARVLADVIRVYPETDTYAKVCATFTGLHVAAAVDALQASQGRAEEEGKG